ncbi:TetR/AcrR family transcriptional regulator [Mucilaginibacter aquatilis]|uniref:TetR family transcriptional regulator n=1 Tax=Mucilaginibacter aquatilis TaxID=1517760 RepID=A0A6I4IQD6_9SPHI|nr:TetR/AcrR family transcriptional regulator [Mucilaginibacter aquatilis]MVN91503.1 TetR family transcriptional regulator [Mucilaginibacter aquatilis]
MVKDKDQTKRRLIEAVGELLKNEGYKSLGVNRIARQAGVSKKLIYRYFGNVDHLIEAYVVENDYWLTFSKSFKQLEAESDTLQVKQFITDLLQNQFKYFLKEDEMQRLILWEISGNSELMKSIHRAREAKAQLLLDITEARFQNKNVNFRALAALLVGGIYYTILHANSNGSIFCDIDIHSSEGQNEILKTIERVIDWASLET